MKEVHHVVTTLPLTDAPLKKADDLSRDKRSGSPNAATNGEANGGTISAATSPVPANAIRGADSDTSSSSAVTMSSPILTDIPCYSPLCPPDSHSAEILKHCRRSPQFEKNRGQKLERFLFVEELTFLLSKLPLNFCGSIIALSFMLKTAMLPMTILQERNRRRMSLHAAELRERRNKITSSYSSGTRSTALKIRQEYTGYQRRHGLRTVDPMLVVQLAIQTPILLSFWRTTRKIANSPDEFRGFAMEAPLWLDSLAAPDPFYILPVVYATILIINILASTAQDRQLQMRGLRNMYPKALAAGGATLPEVHRRQLKTSAMMVKSARWGTLMSIVVFGRIPAGMLIYLISNATLQASTLGLLRLPAVERYFGMEPVRLNVGKELKTIAKSAAYKIPAVEATVNLTTGLTQYVILSLKRKHLLRHLVRA